MLIALLAFSGFNSSSFFSLDIVLSNRSAAQSTNLINQSSIQRNQQLRIEHLLHLIRVITIFVIDDQWQRDFKPRISTFYPFDKNQLGFGTGVALDCTNILRLNTIGPHLAKDIRRALSRINCDEPSGGFQHPSGTGNHILQVGL